MKLHTAMFFSLFIGSVLPSAIASTNEVLVDGLSHCMSIENSEQRLNCFDDLANQNVKVISTVKANDEVATTQSEQVKLEEAKKIDDFSKEDLKKTEEEKGPDSIIATISNVKQLIRGQWVIYFENGQKWQQQDSAKIKLKIGDNVRLKKGSMGAVYLFKEDSHRNIRVKRLK